MKDSHCLLRRALEAAAETIDPARVADARRRQADMFAWRQSDSIPLIFGAAERPLADLPDFDWSEQFADPAASLYMQIKHHVLPAAAAEADYVPSVRADTGVINGPTVLGAAFDAPSHTKPVINGRVSKERLAAFQAPDDISGLGVIPTMIEHSRHHLAALAEAGLGGLIGLRHCDLQGPFDIAAQAYGHDAIFVDMYIDQPFLADLLAKCADIFIKMARLCKDLAGEPFDSGLANEFYMGRGSVRLCDDSGILVSAGMYEELLAPSVAAALAPFGGGWIHYCGGVPDGNRPEGLHLHDAYCSISGMRGLQFTTGRDLPAEIRKLIRRRVVYLGGMPRQGGEPLADYFRRVLTLCDGRCGMIFSASLRQGEQPRAAEAWRRAQNDLLGR